MEKPRKKIDNKQAAEELNATLWPKMTLSQLYKQRDLLSAKITATHTMTAAIPSAQYIYEYLQRALLALNELIETKEKDRQ